MTQKISNKEQISQELILRATDLGMEIVEEVMNQALRTNPNMTLRQFQVVLQQFRERSGALFEMPAPSK